jgi:hypothetical protein
VSVRPDHVPWSAKEAQQLGSRSTMARIRASVGRSSPRPMASAWMYHRFPSKVVDTGFVVKCTSYICCLRTSYSFTILRFNQAVVAIPFEFARSLSRRKRTSFGLCQKTLL